MKKLFSVVIPIYKNEKNLDYTVPYIIDKMPLFDAYNVEIIMVNDGSPDNSYNVMKEWQKKYPELIRVASLTRNFGQAACMHAGMQLAKGDVIGVISADMQEPFELFADMLKEWEKGYKFVAGVRSDREEKGIYGFCAKVFHSFIHKHMNAAYPKGGTDFFLMDREAMEHFLEIDRRYSGGFMIKYWPGYELKEIPYVRQERKVGKSGYSFMAKIEIGFDILFSNSIIMLRTMLVIGILLVILGLLGCIVSVVMKKIVLLLIGVILFCTGLLLMGMCALGEYGWRTYELSKNRPRYVLKEEINEIKDGK